MQPLGHRCGYVGIKEKHNLYGVGYVDTFDFKGEKNRLGCFFDVHGGITFSGKIIKEIFKSDLWWFGFDCAHLGDARDLTVIDDEKVRESWERLSMPGTIKTLEYCVAQCESLSKQLAMF